MVFYKTRRFQEVSTRKYFPGSDMWLETLFVSSNTHPQNLSKIGRIAFTRKIEMNFFLLQVEQDTEGPCNDASSYCGIKDRLYPDRRSMGFPFDRVPRDGVDTLQQFLTPNMRVQDVVVQFSGRTLRPRSRS